MALDESIARDVGYGSTVRKPQHEHNQTRRFHRGYDDRMVVLVSSSRRRCCTDSLGQGL